MTIREIGQLMRTRKVSCVEWMQQTLKGIRERDVYNSFITVIEDSALAEAAERDRELAAGQDRGPLHGVPVGYKDLFFTRGIRTTGGSLIYKDFVPSYDATVVARLREAGAVCVGKTNLHELAYGITSKNPHYGAVLNPRDTTRIPGGSSGGSASPVAAGLLPMCLGSDTGGSIRVPASYCGVVGLKPTYGRVSCYGVLPLAESLDHVGPLGSCVEDCALTMDAIAGPDPLDPNCASAPSGEFNLDAVTDFNGVRVGVPKAYFFDRVDEQVARAVRKAIATMARQGAVVTEVELSNIPNATAAALDVLRVEASAVYTDHADSSLFGSDVWNLIQQGKTIAGYEYVNAKRVRRPFREKFDALWTEIDVLVTPTTPIVAPLAGNSTVQIGTETEDTRMASTRFVRAINFLGEPALSLPCGKTSEGLPIGLQLIGAPFSEPKLLQVAKTLERELG
jgi:aspartyl-tRNA(Asn)/glutamyl-tRNA(Gln) amidotransferase subunit A